MTHENAILNLLTQAEKYRNKADECIRKAKEITSNLCKDAKQDGLNSVRPIGSRIDKQKLKEKLRRY